MAPRWLGEVLARGVARRGNDLCLRDPRVAVTWRELDARVAAQASALSALTAPGDRVVVLSASRVEVVTAFFACSSAAVVAVPLNPGLTDPELTDAVDALVPTLVVGDAASTARACQLFGDITCLTWDQLLDRASGAPGERVPDVLDDAVMLLHTSATTGRPKPVVVDSRYLQFQAMSWSLEMALTPGTVYLNTTPLFSGTSVIGLSYLAAGGAVALLDSFSPATFFRALEDWDAQHVLLTPSMAVLVTEDRRAQHFRSSSLRMVLLAGAPVSPALTTRTREVLRTEAHVGFGITEGSGFVFHRGPVEVPGAPPVDGAECAGRPLPGVAVRVRAETAEPVASAGVGLLHVKNDGITPGYWDNAAATAAAISDGWLNTGDIGCVDADGLVWTVNRRTDLILRGGQNVYPAEVERVIRGCAGVHEVAVVGRESRLWGHTPVAFVERTADGVACDEQQITRACVAGLASFKRPSSIVFVDELPRNPLGKVLRRELARLAGA